MTWYWLLLLIVVVVIYLVKGVTNLIYSESRWYAWYLPEVLDKLRSRNQFLVITAQTLIILIWPVIGLLDFLDELYTEIKYQRD